MFSQIVTLLLDPNISEKGAAIQTAAKGMTIAELRYSRAAVSRVSGVCCQALIAFSIGMTLLISMLISGFVAIVLFSPILFPFIPLPQILFGYFGVIGLAILIAGVVFMAATNRIRKIINRYIEHWSIREV